MSVLTIDEIKTKVAPIAKQFNVSEIYLFGSYASGEATNESDIDLVFEAKGSNATGIMKKNSMKRKIEKELGKNVDLLRTEAIDNVDSYLEDLKSSYYDERILIHALKETSKAGS